MHYTHGSCTCHVIILLWSSVRRLLWRETVSPTNAMQSLLRHDARDTCMKLVRIPECTAQRSVRYWQFAASLAIVTTQAHRSCNCHVAHHDTCTRSILKRQLH